MKQPRRPVLRIVAGDLGGRRLLSPKGAELRPTQDRIKQVIFSALGARIIDARVLDLFAGTGALGIESLSRGAASVTFVESNRHCVEVIRDNLTLCKLSGDVRPAPVERFLAAATSDTYSVIFADPPYDKFVGPLDNHPLPGLVASWLAPGGVFVWEHYAGQQFKAEPVDWEITRDRHYGETGLTFLKRRQ